MCMHVCVRGGEGDSEELKLLALFRVWNTA